MKTKESLGLEKLCVKHLNICQFTGYVLLLKPCQIESRKDNIISYHQYVEYRPTLLLLGPQKYPSPWLQMRVY